MGCVIARASVCGRASDGAASSPQGQRVGGCEWGGSRRGENVCADGTRRGNDGCIYTDINNTLSLGEHDRTDAYDVVCVILPPRRRRVQHAKLRQSRVDVGGGASGYQDGTRGIGGVVRSLTHLRPCTRCTDCRRRCVVGAKQRNVFEHGCPHTARILVVCSW